VNLVYIISAHRLPEQLVRLVTRLRTENATMLVHVRQEGVLGGLRCDFGGRALAAGRPPPRSSPDGGLDHIDRWYSWVRGRRLQVPSKHGQGRLGSALTLISRVVPRRRVLPGLRPYGGSSYWCLSGDAVSLVHLYCQEPPRVRLLLPARVRPDELFLQTILVISESRNRPGGAANVVLHVSAIAQPAALCDLAAVASASFERRPLVEQGSASVEPGGS
jgi:hypothetical protein